MKPVVREIDVRAIAQKNYQRRIDNPALSTLTVTMDARAELKEAIRRERAEGSEYDASTVNRLEQELYRELLAAAGGSLDE